MKKYLKGNLSQNPIKFESELIHEYCNNEIKGNEANYKEECSKLYQ